MHAYNEGKPMGPIARTALVVMMLGDAGFAQRQLTPEELLLGRIRARAQENLDGLPNYTCLETIERSVRKTSSRRFEIQDLLRLEVAYVDRKEMFAWPGSAKFDDRDITEMVGQTGAIGNGSFALHVSGLFRTNSATFRHVGKVSRDGRDAIQFDYNVPRLNSGYRMRVRPAEAFVGYEGSFWVDPLSLDLREMTLVVNDIPPSLPIRGSTQTLTYHRARIGAEDFLLAKSADLSIVDLYGNESRNRTLFSNCRQYAIESVVRFEDVPDDPKAAYQPPEKVVLPRDVEVATLLQTPILGGVSAIGDELRAVLASDVKFKKQVLIPKGATVKGRIVKMQRLQFNSYVYWQVGLRFDRIESGNRYVELEAALDPTLSGPLPVTRAQARDQAFLTIRGNNVGDPRIGILYIRGDQGKVATSTRLYWRTLTPSH
jgi:hypothetical protein